MSEAPDLLADLTDRLAAAAAELRGGDLDPDGAAALVDRCAELAGQAAAELDRRARASESGRRGTAGQLALEE